MQRFGTGVACIRWAQNSVSPIILMTTALGTLSHDEIRVVIWFWRMMRVSLPKFTASCQRRVVMM